MKPILRSLGERLAITVEEELLSQGVDFSLDGRFCPSCREKMTSSVQLAGYYTRPGADLWVCKECVEAILAERLIWAVSRVSSLSLKERVALCFRGKVPQTWLDHWHQLCKRFF